jgi:hypothetical protein
VKDLKYAVARNEKHNIIVATWQERKAKDSRQFVDHYKITIDGKVLDEGVLNTEDDE